ncbi:MAG: hypothetical protein WBC91_22470, partial [Phototrophicaceae bacterium]
MQKLMLKRFVLILAALALVLALFPVMSFAQEGDGGEEDTAAETVEAESEGEEEAHSEAEEEGSDGLEALGINTGFLFGQIVNISVLFLLLGTLLWKPALNMMNTRSAKIQKGLEDAAAAARARQNAEAEADKILAEARAERQ